MDPQTCVDPVIIGSDQGVWSFTRSDAALPQTMLWLIVNDNLENINQWNFNQISKLVFVESVLIRAGSRFAPRVLHPSQWETSLQSNVVSQWLDVNLGSALLFENVFTLEKKAILFRFPCVIFWPLTKIRKYILANKTYNFEQMDIIWMMIWHHGMNYIVCIYICCVFNCTSMCI